MAERTVVVYPVHLFRRHPLIHGGPPVRVLLIIDPEYATTWNFHRLRRAFTLATCRAYVDDLGVTPNVREAKLVGPDDAAAAYAGLRAIADIAACDPVDHAVEGRLRAAAGRRLTLVETPGFIIPRDTLVRWFARRRRATITDFTTLARPLVYRGRAPAATMPQSQPIPRDRQAPAPHIAVSAHGDGYWNAAVAEVDRTATAAPGIFGRMRYPVTHEEAEKWFSEFVSQRLAGFGTHYGALSRRSMIAYHSVLSPLLNSGLLIPERVMSRVGANEAFIAGMIRREFMRALYVNPGTNGVDHPHSAVPTRNFVGVRRRLSPNWYDAATGIDPVDTAIAAVQRFAYTPHTDRALLGTAMLMCDVAPGAVYRWFMEMFVDSYNWTLVGPVMCVSQHSYGPVSDGPYLPSAAKIRETSDYAAGAWCAKWDALLARMRSKRHAALGITRGPDEPEAVRTANRLLTLI